MAKGIDITPGFVPVAWRDYTSAIDYLVHLYREFDRMGIGRTQLTRTEQSVIRNVMDFLAGETEPRLAEMHDPSSLNLEALCERSGKFYVVEGATNTFRRAAKPRVTLAVAMTNRGNFAVTWQPTGWPAGPTCDWTLWRRFKGVAERPSNELMFIRGVGDLEPDPAAEPHANRTDPVLHHILICLVRAAFNQLLHRLEWSFDVERLADFHFDTVKVRNDMHRGMPIDVVVNWSLGKPAPRTE